MKLNKKIREIEILKLKTHLLTGLGLGREVELSLTDWFLRGGWSSGGGCCWLGNGSDRWSRGTAPSWLRRIRCWSESAKSKKKSLKILGKFKENLSSFVTTEISTISILYTRE